MEFTDLHAQLAAFKEASAGGLDGSKDELQNLMQSLIEIKAVQRAFVQKGLRLRAECDAEKKEAERLQLKLQNLYYKRMHLVSSIAQNEDLPTPETDKLRLEMSTKQLGVKKFSETQSLRSTHESVLTLMLQEQISRKQDKLVLAQRMKEREKQVAELDTKRSFLDGTLKQKISEVHQTVDAVAGGFRDDDEEEKIMSKDAMEES